MSSLEKVTRLLCASVPTPGRWANTHVSELMWVRMRPLSHDQHLVIAALRNGRESLPDTNEPT